MVKKAQARVPGRTEGVGLFGTPTVQTRHCPDHPGTQVARIGPKSYQCPIDNKVYNYAEGFTKENGEQVSGGGVGLQIPEDPSFWIPPHDLLVLEGEAKKLMEKQAELPMGTEVRDVRTLEEAAEKLGGAVKDTWYRLKSILTTKAREEERA
jgi:hypothetical protein